MKDKKKKLTGKELVFVEEYIRSWNGAASARAAGYSPKSAKEQAYDLLTKPHILERIEERLEEIRMNVNEIYARLSEQGRADISEFIQFAEEPVLDKDGKFTGTRQVTHIKQEAFELRGHLVKSISPATTGGFRVELHSSQNALELMGKSYSLFTDKDDEGKPLTDDQRIARVIAIYDAARARRT